MNQKNILRVAVAGCFGVMAGQALAVVDLSSTTPAGNKYAKENLGAATVVTDVGQELDVKVAVPVGYVPTAANPLYIKLNLTNGASFISTPPTIKCGTAAAANSVSGSVTLGGAGTAGVTFLVESGAASMSGTCSATVTGITISGQNTVALSATVEYKNGLSTVVTGATVNYITFVRGMSASVISADGGVIVDATSGSDNLSTSSNRSSMWLATLGAVQWAAVGTSAANVTNAQNVSAGDVLSTGSITVNGPAVGVALAANGNSGIFLSTISACTSKDYTVSASATNSVTFNNVSMGHLSAASGMQVCMNVSGNTSVIPTGQFTASVGGTAKAGITADFSAASDKMETVTTNGTTKNAFFVNASTSAAKTSVLRVINTGAVSAAFTATAYTVDALGDGNPVAATVLGTANTALGTIAVGGALSLSSAQLEAKLGFTPSSGTSKYRVVISAGTDAMEVLNYTKDVATGAIVLSQSQTN